jgi:hypothetical protein
MSRAADPNEGDLIERVRGGIDTIPVPPRPPVEDVIRRGGRRRLARIGTTGLVVVIVVFGLAWAGVSLAGLHHQGPAPATTGHTYQAPMVVARIKVPSPGEVVAGAGSIWARSWDRRGTLWRIDPSTNRIIARIAPGSPGGGFLAMSFGEGALWLLDSDGTVVRVDPAKDAVVARISTTADALSLAAGEGRVWVSCCGPETQAGHGSLIGIDPLTDRVVVRIPLRGDPGSVVVGHGAVWVLDYAQNALLRIDPLSHAIKVIRVASRNVADVAIGTDAVWITARAGDLVRVDPRTNRIVATIAVPGSQSGMTTADGAVWINSGPLVKVDAVRNRVSETVPLFSPCDCNAGIAVLGRSVWVADTNHGTVIRIDRGH